MYFPYDHPFYWDGNKLNIFPYDCSGPSLEEIIKHQRRGFTMPIIKKALDEKDFKIENFRINATPDMDILQKIRPMELTRRKQKDETRKESFNLCVKEMSWKRIGQFMKGMQQYMKYQEYARRNPQMERIKEIAENIERELKDTPPPVPSIRDFVERSREFIPYQVIDGAFHEINAQLRGEPSYGRVLPNPDLGGQVLPNPRFVGIRLPDKKEPRIEISYRNGKPEINYTDEDMRDNRKLDWRWNKPKYNQKELNETITKYYENSPEVRQQMKDLIAYKRAQKQREREQQLMSFGSRQDFAR